MGPLHPDPLGDQLVVIANALERAFWTHGMSECFEDVGIFYECVPQSHLCFPCRRMLASIMLNTPNPRSWSSLYQEHGGKSGRTSTQVASFKRALNTTMDLWYSHQMISALLVTTLPAGYEGGEGGGGVTPYARRGW